MKQFTGFIKGVNLGGWLSQYPKYSEKHFNAFIQEADIQRIVKMGFDHIRIPVDYNVLETETAEIIPVQDVVYNFCGKLFVFANNNFEKFSIGTPMAKVKVNTPRKCKYKMFLTTFYDEITQAIITKYMVEPN